jgi:hypothetical protein
MRTFETPYAADWFAISLRGAAILGLLLYLARRALGLGGHPTSETTLPEHH